MAKADVILAIDQGTTGTTALLVDRKLKVLGSADLDFRQIYPKPGWVEHNLDDIWKSTVTTIRNALKKAKVRPSRIAGIGITNQRETVCFWSRKTGKPLHNAIVWQDRRTSEACTALKQAGEEPRISRLTGLVIDPYFSGSKIQWALRNIPKVKTAATTGDLMVGTIDTYLLYRLTNGAVHATEPSNASRTLLFNIETLQWDDELLRLFDVPRSALPTVKNSADHFGETKSVPGLPDGIPICGILGDQQSALLGQGCIEEGSAKCTYGTGSFILMNTGRNLKRSSQKQLTTVAWRIHGDTMYALEGGAFTAGAAVQWFRDGLNSIKTSPEIETLAKKVKTTDGVVFVPAFVGLGAPHWAADARASFFGITRGTTKHHMARAILEGIALMNHDILRAMEKDLGASLKSLNVDGGASKNDLLMQFQSDMLAVELVRPKMIETTALGAVFVAGLQLGVWQNLGDICRSWKKDKAFLPKMPAEERAAKLQAWNSAIKATISFKA